MGKKRAYKSRKSGGGRKKLKPEYDARKNLKEQMESAVALYEEECSLQDIADALALNSIKVRKLLITAGVYESEVAEKVKNTFEEYRETQDYKTSILSTANALQLSKASVTSYLPYQKGVYFPSTASKEKISVGAERQRRYRAMKRWRADPTEENFWGVVLAYAGIKFKTYSGLPFSYEIKKGRNGEYTKELWIYRREKSKSLAWSSIVDQWSFLESANVIKERCAQKNVYRNLARIFADQEYMEQIQRTTPAQLKNNLLTNSPQNFTEDDFRGEQLIVTTRNLNTVMKMLAKGFKFNFFTNNAEQQ